MNEEEEKKKDNKIYVYKKSSNMDRLEEVLQGLYGWSLIIGRKSLFRHGKGEFVVSDNTADDICYIALTKNYKIDISIPKNMKVEQVFFVDSLDSIPPYTIYINIPELIKLCEYIAAIIVLNNIPHKMFTIPLNDDELMKIKNMLPLISNIFARNDNGYTNRPH